MPTRSVALITYHAAHNNGSFLQAYATQRKIQQLGYDCDIINFSTPRQQYLYDVYKKVSGPKDIAKNLYALFHHKLIQRRHNDFTNLMHSALQLTPKFYEDLSQMGDLETQYDVFVSGSDHGFDVSGVYCTEMCRETALAVEQLHSFFICVLAAVAEVDKTLCADTAASFRGEVTLVVID